MRSELTWRYYEYLSEYVASIFGGSGKAAGGKENGGRSLMFLAVLFMIILIVAASHHFFGIFNFSGTATSGGFGSWISAHSGTQAGMKPLNI